MPYTRILLVEDSPVDRKIALASLEKKYTVITAESLAEAQKELDAGKFDLILLDVDLPDGNGFRFVSGLKGHDCIKNTPIFFITRKSETPDEVLGFALGADDYLAKPVDPMKLRARVDAKLLKAEEARKQNSILQNTGLRLNFTSQQAYLLGKNGEKTLDLTPLEFKILAHFMKHENHVFTREQLIDRIWGISTNVIDRTVDMHVSNLRRKIDGSGYTIFSLRGVGYRFSKETSQ